MLLSKPDLLNAIINAIAECGWNVAYLDSPPTHPFRLTLFSSDEAINLRIYIWNLTHGGGPRAAQEYRIQVTGVPTGIAGERGFKTLILGYWTGGGVFAGFDFRKHNGSISYSPSIQIRQEALELANIQGFAPHNKGGGELAIAFRPDFFVEYCRNFEALHSLGSAVSNVEVLETIAQETTTINDAAIQSAPVARREVLRRVAAGHIAAQFRKRVLTAYEYRCAFCGLQLGLVEAAHIVPASYVSASFETCNGIALCALHHQAFDISLVGFNTRYRILLNENAFKDLRNRDRADGEQQFRRNLRSLLLLPPTANDRPHVSFIQKGLELRQWPHDLW
jgi:putative restriction endonuclease